VTWHPSGELLAIGFGTHVEMWDVDRQRRNWSMDHRGGWTWTAFNQKGDVLVSWGWSSRVNFWNPHTGQKLFTTTGGWAGPFGPDDCLGMLFPEAWKEERGPLCHFEPGREYRTLVAGAGRTDVRDYGNCSVHPGGRLLAVATQWSFSLMDLATGTERVFALVAADAVLFEPGGALLVTGRSGLERWPVAFDPGAGHKVRVGPPEPVPVPAPDLAGDVACSADGQVLAAGAFNGAYVWRRDSPKAALHLQPHADCRYVAVSPDGKLVATGAHNGTGLKVWDVATGKLLKHFLPSTMWTTPHFSPDGSWLANSSGHSWRVADWSPGPNHPGGVVAFSPDHRLAAWGWQKGVIVLVDVKTGREIARLEDPHQDARRSLNFTADGTQLIGTTNDSSCVRVWDLRKIREGLKELGLDWDAPPYPPAKTPVLKGLPVPPLEVEVIEKAE
jgi:WD40 repeat protein